MARTQGRILATIWNDPEWRALPKDPQRLYMLLLSQGRMNLAGSIDLMPGRWAALAEDDTVDAINTALTDLERRRFVAVDWDTGELIVRTFVKHDLARCALNGNLLKGFWTAWESILSPRLRQLVIANTPDVVWEKSGGLTPSTATETRRSLPLEPDEPPSSVPPLEPPNEPPSERYDDDDTTDDDDDAAATPNPTAPPTNGHSTTAGGGNPDRILNDAARLLGLAEADRRGPEIGNAAGYARSRITPLRQRHDPAWRAALDHHPDLTAQQLADQILTPTPTTTTTTRTELPDAAAVIAGALPNPDQIADAHTNAATARAALRKGPTRP